MVAADRGGKPGRHPPVAVGADGNCSFVLQVLGRRRWGCGDKNGDARAKQSERCSAAMHPNIMAPARPASNGAAGKNYCAGASAAVRGAFSEAHSTERAAVTA